MPSRRRTLSATGLPERYAAASILIVDDQQSNVDVLQKMLRNYGFRNLFATTDPRQVADMYRQHRYDLVLLDIRMPHLGGFEVLGQLTEIERSSQAESYLPVLMLTAQDDMPTRLRALDEGAQDFITKPYVHAEVLHRVCNMLEVRLLHNAVRDQNRNLEEQVRRRTHELHETRLEIIRRLGKAVDYRDNETGNHVVRMSQYCARLSTEIGWSAEQRELLLNASPMHDIGKIGIPDRILLKPAKLDAEEWEIMKTHTTIGARILEGHSSDLLQMAHEIALTHHEKWDATGYPTGIGGEDIPVSGRIVAVCDMFDALTSVRPYKRAWPVEEAEAELHRCAGNHLDPGMVAAFQSALPDILALRERYSDPAAPEA
ncbi:MAG: response regulator [Nitrospirota bacterium]|nr:response regulator [Nitrospirota bacterium]